MFGRKLTVSKQNFKVTDLFLENRENNMKNRALIFYNKFLKIITAIWAWGKIDSNVIQLLSSGQYAKYLFVLLSMQLVGSELEPEHPVHTRKRTLAKRNAEKFLDKKAYMYDVEKNSILGSSTDANAANSADQWKRDTEHA